MAFGRRSTQIFADKKSAGICEICVQKSLLFALIDSLPRTSIADLLMKKVLLPIAALVCLVSAAHAKLKMTLIWNGTTAVGENEAALPTGFHLSQNFPNPLVGVDFKFHNGDSFFIAPSFRRQIASFRSNTAFILH